MQEFLKHFANQWDETEADVFEPNTEFRSLEEWSSLIGLAIIHMIGKKYNVTISPSEFMACNTIQDLYKLIEQKR